MQIAHLRQLSSKTQLTCFIYKSVKVKKASKTTRTMKDQLVEMCGMPRTRCCKAASLSSSTACRTLFNSTFQQENYCLLHPLKEKE
jgi:hypothetical protein